MNGSSIKIVDGLRVAYQEWGKSNRPKILALHGWLDNSNSFVPLAQHLSGKYHIVAFDHIGHGHSSHIPRGANYSFAKHVSTTKHVFDSLGWDKCHLIGHSMGAGIASVYAAAYPDSVKTTTLIEGFGPITRPVESSVEYMRKAIDAEIVAAKKAPFRKSREYESFKEAVEARIEVVRTYGGEQSLSREAAALLVARGAYRTNDPTNLEDCGDSDRGLSFRYDNRLLLPSHLYFSNEQVVVVHKNIYIIIMQAEQLFGVWVD